MPFSHGLAGFFLMSIFPLREVFGTHFNIYIDKLLKDLLQNQWTNYNRTLHKASLGKGYSSLFKRRVSPFSKNRQKRNCKSTWTNLKIFGTIIIALHNEFINLNCFSGERCGPWAL